LLTLLKWYLHLGYGTQQLLSIIQTYLQQLTAVTHVVVTGGHSVHGRALVQVPEDDHAGAQDQRHDGQV